MRLFDFATLRPILAAAASMAVPAVNSRLICEVSLRLVDWIERMPSIPDRLSSTIFVTSRSTTSAGAPR